MLFNYDRIDSFTGTYLKLMESYKEFVYPLTISVEIYYNFLFNNVTVHIYRKFKQVN